MDRVSRHNLVEDTKNFFKIRFGGKPIHTCSAPGRVNIIGEHTDYNLGLAMPVGIDRWVCVSISSRDDNQIHVYSKNFDRSLQRSLSSGKQVNHLWEKYVVGLLSVVRDDFEIGFGFNMLIYGNVPIGAGVSSSAALEVATLGSIKELYNLSISNNNFLKICNRVDNEFVGVQSGMLDQYVSLLSKEEGPMLIDFSKSKHQMIEGSFKNGEFVLINSMIDRALAQSEYNLRVEQCREGLKLINRKLGESKKIYEIDHGDLDYLDRSSIYFLRLHHVVSENQRVLEMRSAIKEDNIIKMGALLNESHQSLLKDYEVSCDEIESIIEVSSSAPGFLGGRIMGGGFGGCTLNLIDMVSIKEFESYIQDSLVGDHDLEIQLERIQFSDGLKIH